MLRDNRLFRLGNTSSATIYTLCLFAFIAGTRWPLRPHYLYYFDSANFALALERFNPALHQPQPPGYPLFVALTRLIHIWVERPEQAMLIAGLLAAFGATALIYRLTADMVGRTAAIVAAALLASNPAFWFGGITNQVRMFLALSSTAVALLAWRALKNPQRAGDLYVAFAALGIAAGFRLVLAGLLFFLLLWVWAQTGRSWRRLAWALLALTAGVLPWASVTVWAVGGVRGVMEMVWAYATDQFHGSSLLFGAAAASAFKMVKMAVVWNFLGVLVWVWMLPVVRTNPLGEGADRKIKFLAIWFLPPFLFSCFVHIGDPDQALGSIPVLSLIGGAVVASVLQRVKRHGAFGTAAVLLAGHTLLFFFPPGKLARASSYHAMAAVDRMNAGAISSIEFLKQGHPVTIVHFGSSVAYRQLEYYFPNDYVVVLPGRPDDPHPEGSLLAYHHHVDFPLAPGPNGVLQPESRRIICLAPFHTDPASLPGWRAYGSVFYKDLDMAPSLTIGPFRLVRR